MPMQNFRALTFIMACAVVACGDVSEPCLTYACPGTTELRGSFEAPAEVEDLAVRICFKDECEESRLQVADTQCRQDDWMCASRSATGAIDLVVQYTHRDNAVPADGALINLEIRDGAGELLLEASTAATYTGEQVDHCHYCWSGEATF
jgi:hypothetical protein